VPTHSCQLHKQAALFQESSCHAVFYYALGVQERLSAAQRSGVALSSPCAHSIITADPQN